MLSRQPASVQEAFLNEVRQFNTCTNAKFKTAYANCSVLELCLPIGLNDSEVSFDTLIPQRVAVKRAFAVSYCRPAALLYAVRTGFFKTCIVSWTVANKSPASRWAGEMLGLDAISAEQHACHAVAREDSEVCPIHFHQLERLASQIPSLQHNLNKRS